MRNFVVGENMEPGDFGLLVIRVVIGGLFFCHGAMMLFGWFGGGGFARTKSSFARMGFKPLLPFAIAAPATQLVCGLMVAGGFFWPIGPALLVGPMTVAIVGIHWPRLWVTEQGIEFPLAMGAVMLGMGLLPAGELSLDELFGIALPAPETFWVALVLAEAPSAVALATFFRARRERARTAAAAAPEASSAAPPA